MARLQLPSRPPERLRKAADPAVARVPPAPRRLIRPDQKIRLRRLGVLAALVAVLLVFWQSVALLPLRLVVVTFHELGHAAMAWVTGGEVVEVMVGMDEGGRTVTRGGDPVLILNGGYLGSLVAGLAMLWFLELPGGARTVAGVLGGALSIVAVRWFTVSGTGFGLVLVTGVLLIGVATRSPEWLVEWAVRLVGWFSIIYALVDLRADVFAAGGAGVLSDAAQLEGLTSVPAVFWGFGWLVAGLFFVWAMGRRLV